MSDQAEAKAAVRPYEPISTVIIGKNCAKNLRECLASLKGFVLSHLGDEVVYLDTGSTDGGKTLGVAKKWGCRVISRPDLSDKDMIPLIEKYLPDRLKEISGDSQFAGGFLRDFAEARTIVDKAAKNDLIFWIDTDDVLRGGQTLRAMAHEFFQDKLRHNALFLRYDYAFDEDDVVTTVLWRERILRKSQYKWLGICHETLIPRDMNPELAQKCPDPGVSILHKNHRKSIWSDIRNYVILMNAYDKAVEVEAWLDPRWDFYIGNALRGMENYDLAVKWYGRVLKRSGSRDDRFTACMNIAIIHSLRGRYWLALDWCWQAVKICPQEPRVWFGIARNYHDLGKHHEAIQFTDWGKQLPVPDTLTAVDPTGYDFYPDVFAAMSFRALKDYKSMLGCAQSAIQRRPNWTPAQEILQAARGEFANNAVKQAIGLTCQHAKSIEDKKKILFSLQPEVRKGFRELQLEEPRKRAPKTITYVCPGKHEAWDGTSLADGIGGSEKMVILLARAWAASGWRVEVYGNPKDENCYKKIDGVSWKPIEAFNPAAEYDVVVGWRWHGLLDMSINCKKFFMDLHDVQTTDDYLGARFIKCDGYFFKSEFHAKEVRDKIPEELVIISRNGVDTSHFEQAVERIPKKAIFCSSADRGLKRVLKIWERVCGGHPTARLHIFYGFNKLYHQQAVEHEYHPFGDEGCDRHMLDYEEECYSMVDRLKTVEYHGRVDTEVLAKNLLESSVWLYPTDFPEISCMSAMEVQCAGVIPIVFPTGALEETVFEGFKVKTDDGVITSINKVFGDEAGLAKSRLYLAKIARERFGIEPLASEWLKIFEGTQP